MRTRFLCFVVRDQIAYHLKTKSALILAGANREVFRFVMQIAISKRKMLAADLWAECRLELEVMLAWWLFALLRVFPHLFFE